MLVETPFRVLFLVRDSLDHLEVVCPGHVQAAAQAPPSLVISGRAELLAFIRDVGLDSIVESYQVSDLPQTGFLYSFHVASSAESIVDLLTERQRPATRATYRVLELSHEKVPEQLTLSPHEAFQLGAATLSLSEGIAKVCDWARARALVSA